MLINQPSGIEVHAVTSLSLCAFKCLKNEQK